MNAPREERTSGSVGPAPAVGPPRRAGSGDPRAIHEDAAFMERALFWAERGRGRTSPNPIVGAVVVSPDGVVVGQGAHLVAGGPHAEVHALDAAGPRAAGATLYCTLEPCCHIGRTGPCVERIAAAGVARVVAALRDPDPRVAGKGFEDLRSRGIRVDVGIGGAEARRQNEPFFSWTTRRRPFVIVKAAVSADGFVGRSDAPVKLTGPAADRWFQRQRAEVDALAVGSGTVLTDDPLLTAREVYRARPLTRVLFDWRARLEGSARVFSTLGAGPIVLIVSHQAGRDRAGHLESLRRRGVTIEQVEYHDLRAALVTLADLRVLSLLVEGGPRLQTAFAKAGVVDRVQRIATPHVLGTGLAAPVIVRDTPDWAGRLRFGDDTLIEFDVHGTR
jgi:diaminohydroxyphosphoribosylaminopyrimidine deaminase/5-amino-6-(5-phosphoribosylamino)uracil reductase